MEEMMAGELGEKKLDGEGGWWRGHVTGTKAVCGQGLEL